MTHQKQGFTLVELLVVVLIIGILASVAVPQYQKAVIKSRFATLKALTKALAESEEIYYLANNEYATQLAELDIDIPSSELAGGTNYKNIYSWGQCWISPSTPMVACQNTQIGITFRYYFKNSTELQKGKYICITSNADLNSAQNKICQQETSKDAPYYKDTASAAWAY